MLASSGKRIGGGMSTVAVVARAFGGPEVLSVIETRVPDPGPGEVLLEVRAAGVNPIDWMLYSGARGTDARGLPMRLGFEAAGVVVAVGAGAVGPAGSIEVRDEVVAYRAPGAYARHLVVPAASVLPRPKTVSWEQAGGLMVAGVTAVHALTAVGVREGETVLIHAASGGVGAIASQLAVARGARVIGTASEARHDHLRTLGVQPVAYGPGLLDRVRALASDRVDAAIDAAGTDEAIDVSVALVGDRRRVATIVSFARGAAAGIRLLGGAPGVERGEAVRMAARGELLELAGSGRLRLEPRAFSLEHASAAHRLSMRGAARGKLVLIS